MTHILIQILLLISFTFSSASAASVFFSRGNLTVLASTDYIFQILLDQSIPAGEILSVTFSNGFTVPSGPLSICTLDNANLAGCTCLAQTCQVPLKAIPVPSGSTTTVSLQIGNVINPPAVVSIMFTVSSATIGTKSVMNSRLKEGSLYITSTVVEVPKVQESTNYIITFLLTYEIPQGGMIAIKFPSESTNSIIPSTHSITISYGNGPATTYPALPMEEKVTITAPWASSGYSDLANPITLTLMNVENQKYQGLSGEIELKTMNQQGQGINVNVFKVSITQAGTVFTQSAMVSGSRRINDITSLDLTWMFDIRFDDTNKGPYYFISVKIPNTFTLESSTTCSVFGGLVVPNTPTITPTCEVKDSQTIHLKYVIYNSAGSPAIFSINGIQNPLSTRPLTTPFKVDIFQSSRTDLSDPQLIALGEYTWDWTPNPGTLVINQITRSADNLGNAITLNFDITLPDTIEQGSLFEFQIPKNQIFFNGNPTCQRIINNVPSDITCTIDEDSETTTLTLTNICQNSGVCVKNTNFLFRISQTTFNPEFVQLPQADSMSISTKTSDGNYYFHRNIGNLFATPGLSFSVPTGINCLKTGNQYNVVNKPFTFEMTFIPYQRVLVGGFVYLHFPTDTIYLLGEETDLECTYKDDSTHSETKECVIQRHTDSNSISTIGMEVCSGLSEACIAPLTFTITGVKNPGNAKPIPTNDPENSWWIETGLSFTKRIDYKILTTELPDVAVIANNFGFNEMKSSNKYVYKTSSYVFNFTVSTPIPANDDFNSRIILTIPSEVTLPNTPSCEAKLESSTELDCVITTSSNPKTITIKSDDEISMDSIITVTVNLINPPTTKTSSTFTLKSVSTVDSSDYLIDIYQSNDFNIKALAGTFTNPSIDVNPPYVGSKAVNVFNFTPSTQIPSGNIAASKLIIELPNTMTLMNIPGLAACEANTNSLDFGCSYKIDNSDQQIVLTYPSGYSSVSGEEISVVVPANVIQSPGSTKPTGNIVLRSITTINGVDYIVDELDEGFINDKVNQPAPITSYTAFKNNSRTAQLTDLTITFTPINTLTEDSFIFVSLPKEQILLSSTLANLKASYSGNSIPIVDSSQDDTYIKLSINTPCDPCPSEISFLLTGFRNPLEAITFTESISLTTVAPDGEYLIDAINTDFFSIPRLSSGDLGGLAFASSSRVVGTPTTLSVSFSIVTDLDSTAQLFITFPDGVFFGNGGGISCKNTKETPASNIMCMTVDGTSSYPEPISQIQVLIGSQCTTLCPKGTEFSLTIQGVKNAYVAQPFEGSIIISTHANGFPIDSSDLDIEILPSLIPSDLIVKQARRTNTVIGTKTKLSVGIQLSTLILSNTNLVVDFSKSKQIKLQQNANIQCSLVNPQNNQKIRDLTCTNNGDSSLVITDLCSNSPCNSGSEFLFIIDGVSNANYVKDPLLPEESLILRTTDSDGYISDRVTNGVFVTPSLMIGSLELTSSSMTTRNINEQAKWNFEFSISVPLDTPNRLVIQIPEHTLYKDTLSSAVSCVINTKTINCNTQLYQDNSLGIETITLNNICGPSTPCDSDDKINVTIKGLKNPPVVYNDVNSISIVTQNSDSQGTFYGAETMTNTWKALLGDLIPGTISVISMTGNLPHPEILTNLTITFYNKNPVPVNGVLKLNIPSVFIIPDFVEVEQKCKSIAGFSESLQCRKQNNQLILTNAFVAHQQPSVFSFMLLNVLNPDLSGDLTIQPFSMLIQDSQGYLIDKSSDFNSELTPRDPNLVCDPKCLTCVNSPTECTSCHVPSNLPILSDGSCIAECPQGTTLQGGICLPCYPGCSSCSGTSENQCLICESPKMLMNGQCVTECPLPTTPDTSSSVCENPGPCDENCATCSYDTEFCLSCNPPNILDRITWTCINPSTDTCTNPFYYNSTQNKCVECEPECASCVSSQQCTSCALPFPPFLDTTKTPPVCSTQCPPSTYPDSSNKCVACHPTCLTCSGPNNNQCTSCPSDSPLMQYGECVATCSPGYTLDNESQLCVLPCSDTNCFQCSENDLNTCLVCDEGYFLSEGLCKPIGTCPDGQFFNVVLKTCANCNPSCKTCSGSASNCTSCHTNNTLPIIFDPKELEYLYNGQCLQDCPIGYSGDYFNDKKCREFECKEPCKLCGSAPNICYTCSEKYPYKYEDYCYDVCPVGTFPYTDIFGSMCIPLSEKDKFKLSIPIITLISGTGLSMLALMIANVVSSRRDLEISNKDSLIVLMQLLEVLSKLMLIPNLWGREDGFLFFSILTLIFNMIMGVNFNALYFPIYESHVPGVKNYLQENKKTGKIAKILTYFGGGHMLKMFESGFFTKQAQFRKLKQYSDIEKKNSRLGIIVSLTQILINIIIMATVEVSRDAFGITAFNLGYNVVIVSCLLWEAYKAGELKKLTNKVRGKQQVEVAAPKPN